MKNKIYEFAELVHHNKLGWMFYSAHCGDMERTKIGPSDRSRVEMFNFLSLNGWNFVSQTGRVYFLRKRVEDAIRIT